MFPIDRADLRKVRPNATAAASCHLGWTFFRRQQCAAPKNELPTINASRCSRRPFVSLKIWCHRMRSKPNWYLRHAQSHWLYWFAPPLKTSSNIFFFSHMPKQNIYLLVFNRYLWKSKWKKKVWKEGPGEVQIPGV